MDEDKVVLKTEIDLENFDDPELEMCFDENDSENDLDIKKEKNNNNSPTVKKFSLKSKGGVAVARRNERERNRVKHINRTFTILRQHIPTRKPSKKLSKVDTLKCATEYIRSLQQLIVDHDRFMSLEQNLRTRSVFSASPVAATGLHHPFIHPHHSHPAVLQHQQQHQQHRPSQSFNPSAFLHQLHQQNRFSQQHHHQHMKLPLHHPVSLIHPASPSPSMTSPGYSSDSSWEGLLNDSEETEFTQTMIPRITPESCWT